MSVWDHEMSADEIKALTCQDKGNLVNEDTLKVAGGVDHYEDITETRLIGSGSKLTYISKH